MHDQTSIHRRPSVAEATIESLAGQVRAEHAAALGAAQSALHHARRCGDLLIAAKALVRHGDWLPWLREHCPDVAERTAQAYMRLARRWPELEQKTQRVADLPLREALTMLSDGTEATSMPSANWALPKRCSCLIEGVRSQGEPVDVWIHPSTHDGFVFVNVLRPNVVGERWAIVDGTKKPIRGERIARLLAEHCHIDGVVDLAAADWLDAEPWSFNQALFTSEAEWRAAWLGGEAGHV